MKARPLAYLAVSLFATLGNGQDGGLAPTIVQGGSGPGVQGNVAWTQSQQDAELDRAALAARQKKALMEAMASYSQKPPVVTSAEQYLQVHRPPMTRSPEGPGTTAAANRSNNYVPAFETGATGRGISTSPAPETARSASPELPEKKPGLFALFQSKKKTGVSGELLPDPDAVPVPPAASYPEPTAMNVGAAPAPSAPPAPTDAGANDAIAAATGGGTEPEKPSLFGKLFGKPKSTEPSSMPDPTLSAPVAPAAPPVPGTNVTPPPADPVGIPSPPSFSAPPAPMPQTPTSAAAAEGESSIFVRRSGGNAAGTNATVLETTQATVAGVLVKLYEGSSVSVLERSGSMARVRLADGREGTVAASALSR